MSRVPRAETAKAKPKRPRGRPPKDKSLQPLRKVGRPKKLKVADTGKPKQKFVANFINPPHGPITPEQEDIFFEAMLNAPVLIGGTGNNDASIAACKAICVDRNALFRHKAANPAFSEKWKAVMEARMEIRQEALRDKRDEQNMVFLEVLADTGRIETACQQVGVGRAEMVRRREMDPVFKEAWAAAAELATDMLEDEATRRGVEGWDEPVFYKGSLQGVVRKYSDNLLLASLAARRADKWAKNTNLKLTGSLTLETLVNDAQKLRKRQITLDPDGNAVAQVTHDAF